MHLISLTNFRPMMYSDAQCVLLLIVDDRSAIIAHDLDFVCNLIGLGALCLQRKRRSGW